jgi:threonine dehydratase
MISVAIIGNGNVATHLTNVFLKADAISVTQINSRKLNNIPKAMVTIIAVSDAAIAKVSSKIKNTLVVHTSGSVAMKSLATTAFRPVAASTRRCS